MHTTSLKGTIRTETQKRGGKIYQKVDDEMREFIVEILEDA